MRSFFAGKAQQLLLSLIVLGAAGSVVGTGTFATFSAQTKNPSNTFATGTLVLKQSNLPGSATCLSTSGGNTNTNTNASCTTLINVSNQTPGSQQNQVISLTNDGSLNATTFTVDSTSCTGATLCGSTSMRMYIQQCGSVTSNTCNSPSCVWPSTGANSCDLTKTQGTGWDTLSNWAAASALSLSGLNAGATKNFNIVLGFDSAAPVSLAAQTASLSFTWQLQQ